MPCFQRALRWCKGVRGTAKFATAEWAGREFRTAAAVMCIKEDAAS
ncbi:MAG: hypothetical protein PUC05_07815 [Firmicutes bacterium]|nr:hypothetical protein [Bacillota bacterium]